MISLLGNPRVAHAFSRFGFGGRPDETVPSDPVAWALAQLANADPYSAVPGTSVDTGLSLLQMIQMLPAGNGAWLATVNTIYELYVIEIQTLFSNAVLATAPFRERLVWFWANHFAVMAQEAGVMVTAGAFVRDAIRPHVTGTFADMLVAAITHPAMLYSLNNDTSVGPHSTIATTWARAGYPPLGINENLGRETLELYSLGVNGAYTQADVDAMALLLTGWKVSITSSPRGAWFDPSSAEPGSQTLLGKSYSCTAAGSIAALRALATSNTTYTHLATKLVRHFTTDNPAASDIAAVAAALTRSGGNLGSATAALLNLRSAWTPLTKLRAPSDLAVAAMRASGAAAVDIPAMFASMMEIGDLPFTSDFPDGWSDYAVDWSAPQQIMLRLDWLRSYVGEILVRVSPPSVAAMIGCSIAPLIGAASSAALAQVTAPFDQITVLLNLPEFQRR